MRKETQMDIYFVACGEKIKSPVFTTLSCKQDILHLMKSKGYLADCIEFDTQINSWLVYSKIEPVICAC